MSSLNTGRLAGKVAFITGAGRGQGRSHAVRLAEEGAAVIAIDVCAPIGALEYPLATPDDLEETVRLVEAVGGRILAAEVDIRDRDGLRAIAAKGVESFGKIDTVVANAAINHVGAWDETTPQMWQDIIDVNLTGTWNTVMATVQHVIDSGGGSIILVSSAGGLMPAPFLLAYTASKFGVTGLAKAFAMELGQHNIRVNSLHPGSVSDTFMGGERGAKAMGSLLAANPELNYTFGAMLPVRQVAPLDLSNAVLHLASDEARYVTATAAVVDAGLSQM